MSETVPSSGASTSSTIVTTPSIRAPGRGIANAGRGHRGNRGNRNGGQRHGGRQHVPRSNFKGNTTDMNGHVFECYEECGDRTQYIKTLEALGEYAAKNLKFPEDLKTIFEEKMTTPTLAAPIEIDEKAPRGAILMWEASVKSHARRVDELRSNLTTLYAVIWGQCSEQMRTKVKAHSKYISKSQKYDCVWLLGEVKGVTHQFDTKRYVFLSLHDARCAYYNCKQGQHQTNSEYLEVFRANVEVLEYYKATVGESNDLVEQIGTVAARTAVARGCTIAIGFLKGADSRRYATLLSDLANQHKRGNNQYQTELTMAYSMLVNYHAPNTYRPVTTTPPSAITTPSTTTIVPEVNAFTFAQSGATVTAPIPVVTGTDGNTFSHITCYNCQKLGHVAHHCPSIITLLQHGYILTQSTTTHDYQDIPKSWVLLDSQSTISVFCNPHMVTNIRDSPQAVCVRTNGGQQTSSQQADVKNLGVVWYNPESLANILSLSEVRKVCRVTMDTAEAATITVHKSDGNTMTFTEHEDGLYVHDTEHKENEVTINSNVNSYQHSFLLSVSGNKNLFVSREIEAADKARELYRKLGRPSQSKFEDILAKNIISNCPVTVDDAKRALLIYGPDIATVKGKTTRDTPAPHIPTFAAIPIPAHVAQYHSNITLCIDFFFVQGIGFIHIISRKLQHRIVHPITDRSQATMIHYLNDAITFYTQRGFSISDVHADMEFECIRDQIKPIPLNVVAADSHVGEVPFHCPWSTLNTQTINKRNRKK